MDLMALSRQNSALSQKNAREQMNFQAKESAKLRSFNAQEAQKNRDWQERMANSAHQRELADLKKAGLNPVLSALKGADVGSGSAASQGSSGQGAKGEVDTSAISAIASMEVARLNSSATIAAARASAEAQKYAADLNYKASMYNARIDSSGNAQKLWDFGSKKVNEIVDGAVRSYNNYKTNKHNKYVSRAKAWKGTSKKPY